MIDEFIGEFMFHPAPLEISGNTCSHNCCYCFANIRKECRYLDLKSFINQINKKECKTFKDYLLKEGYPICLSNKSDPFSETNYIQTIEIMRQFTRIKNGLFIQTKGGKGIDETLEIIKGKPVVWYITITTLNEEIRKRIEPNAPSTEERLQLAEKLKNLGYLVIIAINPILEEWMPFGDIDVLLERCYKIGIKHICTEALHLNPKEVASFSQSRKNHFKQSEIDYAVDRKNFQVYVKKVIPYIQAKGFHVMKLGMPFETNFFEDIRKAYGKIYPNQYDIINYAHKNGTGVYSFDDFYNVTVDNKPFFETPFKQVNAYIVKASIHEWAKDEEAKKIFTLKEVLRYIWNNGKIKSSMQRNQAFRLLVDNGQICKDEKNNVLLYFDGHIHAFERIVERKSVLR